MSRREFIQKSSVAVATAGVMPGRISIPIGLELTTVNSELQKDFDGTLRQVAAIGYRQIELPRYYGRNARQLRKSLGAAGLKCESGMFSVQPLQGGRHNLANHLLPCIEFAHTLGLKFMVCPILRVPSYTEPNMDADKFRGALHTLTLDDFKRAANLFNHIGAETRKAGIQFAYHNHNVEFRKFNGVIGYDELLRLTDPRLVAMEMDCGWTASAGRDPMRYLSDYPGRFHLLHIKDLKTDKPNMNVDEMVSVEVGRGVVNWGKVFTAAQAAGVKACFVEQEPPFVRPALESARISYEFLRKLTLS